MPIKTIDFLLSPNHLNKLMLLILLSCSFSSFGQGFKDKQILSYTDTTKTTVTISDFLVFDKQSQKYKAYEINTKDFYKYKKNPLGIRYFNFGCIKTKRKGPWLGQIDKDKRGHAIFKSPIYGIRTMILMNAEIIEKRGKNTLLKFINVYAPSNDCVGSIKDKNGDCKYGYNEPKKYAKRVGDVMDLGINEVLVIRKEDGEIDSEIMTLLLSEVAKFETGKNCKFSEGSIIKALALVE